MSVQLLQDVHFTDEQLWSYFQTYWGQGNYVAALNLLQNNQQLVTKYADADWFNNLTDLVYELENNDDPNFKLDKIKTSYIPPSLEEGEIWFQIEMGDINISVGMQIINPGDVLVFVPYSNKLLNAIAFQDLEVVKTTTIIDNDTVVFALPDPVEQPIVCLVFYTDSADITVTTQTSSNTSVDIPYSGEVVSFYVIDEDLRMVECDASIDSAVHFSITESTNLTYTVVSIPNAQIGTLIKRSVGNILTTAKTVQLVCKNYLISYITRQLVDGNNKCVLTDVAFDTHALVSVVEEPDPVINSIIFYA